MVIFASIASSSTAAAGIPDPDSISAVLTKGSESSITRLSQSLGMTTPKDWISGAKSDVPCDGLDSVSVEAVPLYGRGTQKVLTAHAPSMCAMAFVVVLDRTASGAWRRVDTLRFREHHYAPRISFESLVSPVHKEIVVRNNEIDYGTGIENVRMTIYSVTDLGASVIFDQPSQLVWAVPESKDGQQGLADQSETDVYELLDVSRNSSDMIGIKYIHRVEKIHEGQTQITRSWDYSWHPEYREMVGFQTEALPPMQDFEAEMCGAIEDKWAWPSDLILAGQLGPSVVDFDYIDGNVSNIKVTRSSGSALVDKSYIEAIREARMPAPPVPAQPLHLVATMDSDMGQDDMCFRSKIRTREEVTGATHG